MISGFLESIKKFVGELGESTQPSPMVNVDLIITFDTTGSMSDKIDALISHCQRFVDLLSQRQVDYQLRLVAFGDLFIPGDKIVVYPFTRSVAQFKSALEEIPRFDGGGNEGETSLDALHQSFIASSSTQTDFRPDAFKMLILITDEPPLGKNVNLNQVMKILRDQKATVFCVAPDLQVYHQIAKGTGGKFFEIKWDVDFTSILDRLAKQVATIAREKKLELEKG